jgi:hypothetical protein
MFVNVPEDEKETLSDLNPFETVPLMLKFPVMVGDGVAKLLLSLPVIVTETTA